MDHGPTQEWNRSGGRNGFTPPLQRSNGEVEEPCDFTPGTTAIDQSVPGCGRVLPCRLFAAAPWMLMR
jgi:hypothetical protein